MGNIIKYFIVDVFAQSLIFYLFGMSFEDIRGDNNNFTIGYISGVITYIIGDIYIFRKKRGKNGKKNS